MRNTCINALIVIMCLICAQSCTVSRKLSSLKDTADAASLAPGVASAVPDANMPSSAPKVDTIKVVNVDGKDLFLMSVVKDDDGNMVANQTLEAAVVQARFRNVAERGGKVELGFRITVPEYMRDRYWQLRYTPVMFIMQDSLTLDRLVVTGEQYRRRQLRGYQQYQRFLDSIITDSTAFIDRRALEIFIRRNIPELYAMRADSSFVDDERFAGVFGVNQRQALEHYTNHLAERFNNLRKSRVGKKYRQYVKAPIITEGIRLDTVLRDASGNYVYDYTQTVRTRPGLRKVDIVLDGEIYEQNNLLHRIPRSEPLTFFISSLSSLVDGRERFLKKVVERRVTASASYNIEFASGSCEVKPGLGRNEEEIGLIERQLRILAVNDEFCLDSVSVVASCSPEGALAMNSRLGKRRAEAISAYFNGFTRRIADSLRRESAVMINLDDSYVQQNSQALHAVSFTARHVPENWEMLDILVEEDAEMTQAAKDAYFSYALIKNPDEREAAMRREPWYSHLRKDLYPALRSVSFRFALSRKGMLKDTVHTTEVDSVYMSGIAAIREREYEKAAEILAPYDDYNTAVAFLALDRNHSALRILKDCPRSAEVEYMMAIIHSRFARDEEAVQHYLNACKLSPQFIHRGNLDPEISALIKKYNLSTTLNDLL